MNNVAASHDPRVPTAVWDRGIARAPVTRRVLVVQDDREIARFVELHLRDLPCEVDVRHDGLSALDAAIARRYDAIVLDIVLPHLDGLAVCQALRQQHVYTPILILTSRSTEQDRVVGLELGADDYLTKPFSLPELLARVKALFRRAEVYGTRTGPVHADVLKLGDLEVDVGRRAVRLSGVPVSLTAKEFDLLVCVAAHPGRVYTRAQLLDVVWGYSHDGYDHTVNSHINRLRAKIERVPANPELVLTVWGVGYKFRDVQDA
jgi:DNA-binding response OmpR family regulator